MKIFSEKPHLCKSEKFLVKNHIYAKVKINLINENF